MKKSKAHKAKFLKKMCRPVEVKRKPWKFRPARSIDSGGAETGVTNSRRAMRAEDGCIAWRGEDQPDDTYETNIGDMLGDLMHLCDRDGFDFDDLLRMGRGNYEAER
jgi:hypothetical protein